MEACRAFIADPKNIANGGKFGSFGVINNVGTWDIDDNIMHEGLGHEYCVDDDVDPCVAEGICPGTPLDWMGVCTWPPELFMSSLEAQYEISTKKIPGIDGPNTAMWNEISIPVEANTPHGVEAVFHFGDYFDTWINNMLAQASSAQKGENPFPPDYAEYAKYAAENLAAGYYGGVPVITVTPTKENALAGKIFSCS